MLFTVVFHAAATDGTRLFAALSAALAAHFERCLCIPVDDLRSWVVSGFADSVPWTNETERQFQIAEGAVCDLARAGLDTVALRAPAHPIAQGLLWAFGGPVAAPSANRSGRPSPTTFDAACEETGEFAATALEGGDCEVGLESTVVSLIDGEARLLRPGGVPRAEIEAVIGPLREAEADARRSPGRLARHYAPSVPVRLDASEPLPGEAWLAFGPAPMGPETWNLSPRGDLREAAANLFTYPRLADRSGCKAIAVAPVPEEGLGEAINDRLRRAAGFVG